MYRTSRRQYASFVGSSDPDPKGAGAAIELLDLSDEDLPEVLGVFSETSAQATPEQIRELDDVTFSRVPRPLPPAAVVR